MDRRTIEKVLGAAGAMLGDVSASPSEAVRLNCLHTLEVDCLSGGSASPIDQVRSMTVTIFYSDTY